MEHKFSLLNYPDAELPLFREQGNQNWVHYGADDEYGDRLRDLYLASGVHAAIVNGVSDMIYGEGLHATNWDDSDDTKEQWLRLQQLLHKSDEDLLKKLAFDLKLYGMCYVNVIWNKARTAIAQMRHLPVHTLRSGIADSTGKVNEFYYKPSWDKTDQQANKIKPRVIKAFCMDDRTEASVVFQVSRYTPSYHYYGLPDYVGSLNYVELDRDISKFHLNNIKNGLFPSMLLSFKNGIPTDEERFEIEQKVIQKFTGSENAGRILITFNDGDDSAPEFQPIQTNNADGLYEYLSSEVARKVLTGHRVTSPLLFGIRGDGSGFGSNADELRDSYSLFNNTVVLPFQNLLLRNMAKLFSLNDIHLDLYFKTLKPADFLSIESIDTQDESEQEKEGVTKDFAKHDMASVARGLIGKGEDEKELLSTHKLIDATEVDYETEDHVRFAFQQFSSVIDIQGNNKSDQDTDLIVVRYAYAPNTSSTSSESRDFCANMVRAKKVYKMEDIKNATNVNPGWGKGGADNYNIWLFKGGGSCRHFWERRTYLKKTGARISVKQAKKIIQKAGTDAKRLVQNDRKVAQRPRDMDDRGFLDGRGNWTTKR